MRIWDSGTYELQKWEAGKVTVDFHGERLRGRYALFCAGKAEKDWLIHRIDPPLRGRDPGDGTAGWWPLTTELAIIGQLG
jgi:bifunctional non-homologous end joining protein LigD